MLLQRFAFRLQKLDLLFSLKELALHVVFLAGCDGHLVLDIAKFEGLPLELLFSGGKLLSLRVELILDVVEV